MFERITGQSKTKTSISLLAAGAFACAALSGCGAKEPAPTPVPAPEQESAEASPSAPPGMVQPAPAPKTASSAGNAEQYQAMLQKRNERFAAQDAANAEGAAALAAADAAARPKPVAPEDQPMEGDQIMVDPEQVGVLLPGIDFSKLNRTSPIGIGDLLKQRGIEITSYEQLREMGITNYTIVRAPQRQTTPP